MEVKITLDKRETRLPQIRWWEKNGLKALLFIDHAGKPHAFFMEGEKSWTRNVKSIAADRFAKLVDEEITERCTRVTGEGFIGETEYIVDYDYTTLSMIKRGGAETEFSDLLTAKKDNLCNIIRAHSDIVDCVLYNAENPLMYTLFKNGTLCSMNERTLYEKTGNTFADIIDDDEFFLDKTHYDNTDISEEICDAQIEEMYSLSNWETSLMLIDKDGKCYWIGDCQKCIQQICDKNVSILAYRGFGPKNSYCIGLTGEGRLESAYDKDICKLEPGVEMLFAGIKYARNISDFDLCNDICATVNSDEKIMFFSRDQEIVKEYEKMLPPEFRA